MIRLGIVGYGYWGPKIARAAAEADEAGVAAIADLSEPALARAARQHPTARLHRSWRDLVADPAVDAVIVATPVRSHYEVALGALRAGKPVLVEKPMAETAAQAARLVDEAARRNLTLMVDHTFVYTGAVRAIRRLVDDGRLGNLYYYDSTRINLGLFQNDVNVIWDLAVHDFAILDYLFRAKPAAVSASAAGFVPDRPENMAHLSVYYEDGAMAHLNVNWLAPVKVRQTIIGGSLGMLIYDDMETSEKVRLYDRGVEPGADGAAIAERRLAYRVGDMWAPAISPREALLTEIDEFVRCVRAGGKPTTDGACGLRVVELLAAASRSAAMRGRPVDLLKLREAS